ncbi:MAG: D-alanyl-D-alanine carboxypeptidase/D-alanyl-D-alanine-endopeptidase [Burkholderiaceae bacterium]
MALLVAGLGLVLPAQAASLLPEALAVLLSRAAIPPSAASFFVEDVDGQPPLLAQNADKPMNPASTMKLVTTYTALEVLGPTFTWKTRVSVDAPPSAGVLPGNLYIKGSGDPDLVVERFWLMLDELRARGVREIRGDVVIDRSLFEPQDIDPGAFDNEPYRPYNVTPDAFLVNFKAVDLGFLPDEQQHTIRVIAQPRMAGQQIAPVRYLEGGCGDWQAKLNADLSDPDRLNFVGGFPGACGERHMALGLYSHARYASALFQSLWKELGGTISGTVRDGAVPAAAQLYYEYESPTLAEVIRQINKNSNNVMAKELYLDLSAEIFQLPASAERSEHVIASFLEGHGVAAPELVTENGSGLSRVERMSAQSMGRMLQVAWNSVAMPEYVASLPVVGVDGTMRKRLTAQRVAGQAHIKTGTLADARAVAGYLRAASGRTYVVVSLINHPNAGLAQPVQDAFLQWVYDHG